MAEQIPLRVNTGGGVPYTQFGASDTLPASSLPARSVISPSTISSDQDDYSPTGWADAGLVRLSFDTGGRGITGFAAWTGGKPKTIFNTSGNFGYIACEHPDSSAANRVIGSSDHIIAPYGTLILDYDETSARVRVIGNSFNAAVPGIGNLRGHFYSVSPGSTTAGDWGDWASSGTSIAVTAGTAALPGGWTIGTGTSGTGNTRIYIAKNLLNPTYYGSAHILFSTSVYFPVISDGTQTFTFTFGIVPSPSSATLNVNNSITIQYTHTVNGGNFTGVCRNNAGTESTVDLGVAVAADTLYDLMVCFDKAIGEARFYVNGTMAGRVTGSMPNAVAVGQRAIIVKSAGNTARTAILPNLTFTTVY